MIKGGGRTQLKESTKRKLVILVAEEKKGAAVDCRRWSERTNLTLSIARGKRGGSTRRGLGDISAERKKRPLNGVTRARGPGRKEIHALYPAKDKAHLQGGKGARPGPALAKARS